jgi:hypothetical protein
MWPFTRRAPVPAADRHRVVAYLAPAEVAARGALPPESVIGRIDGDTFTPNPGFVALLHRVVAEAAPRDAAFQRAAAAQREGWVYVIDLRTPQGPHGDVPFADIIGGFPVTDGTIAAKGYWSNGDYAAWSADGITRLPGALDAALRATLLRD